MSAAQNTAAAGEERRYPCPHCHFGGRRLDNAANCATCEGRGTVRDCPNCNGRAVRECQRASGALGLVWCGACDGEGFVS